MKGLFFSACLVLFASRSFGQILEPAVELEVAQNLGYPVDSEVHQLWHWTLFSAVEQNGVDYNGDGDDLDRVAHVYSGRSRTVLNLGLAGRFYSDGLSVILAGDEFQQGGDLNGDGDSADHVIHVFDPIQGGVENLRIQGLYFAVDSGRVAYQGVNAQGFRDLRLLDLATRTVRSTGYVPGSGWLFRHDTLLFSVGESLHGLDLNGDGDLYDRILHYVPPGKTQKVNTGLLCSASDTGFAISPESVSWYVSEHSVGDLNGDGDNQDRVLHFVETVTGEIVNSGYAAYWRSDVALSSSAATFVVYEPWHGAGDLNGDGDTNDLVQHLFDLPTRTSVALEAVDTQAPGDVGGRDDLYAFVFGGLFRYSSPTSNATYLSAAGPGPAGTFGLDRRTFFVVLREVHLGRDLNQDGDIQDGVLHGLTSFATSPFNFQIAAAGVQPGRRSSLFTGFESAQGQTDLNGDGDSDDAVLHLVLHDRFDVHNLGFAGSEGASFGPWFAVAVNEFKQGSTDLNGDGDVLDKVLHVGRVAD